MPLTLVVPGLLDLSPTALEAIDSDAPALARLLASAEPGVEEHDGPIAIACRACGIVKQSDWPVAPQLARAAGIAPDDAYWLCAVPVSLAVSANDVRLATVIDDLSHDEARVLIAALNAHFAPDAVVFFAPAPSSWYVRAPSPQLLCTKPPEAALGEPLFEFLPSGPDAARWRRWQSELQMLLFEHPVNVQRDRAAFSPVNSVWFWGGGVDSPRRSAVRTVFAHNPRVVDLARGSGVECCALPARFDANPMRDAAVWLDAIEPQRASQQLDSIDRAWIAPLENALAAGRLSGVELVVAGRARARRFAPRRSSLVQRWRARMSPPRCSQILARAAAEAALT
jgi:hypothetical protein